MSTSDLNTISIVWSAIALGTFVLLQFVKAPYGRHIEKGWGKEISNKTGWFIMELPSFLIMLYFFVINTPSVYSSSLFFLWLIHYFNRTFLFPFRIKTGGKRIPLLIVLSAILFNSINATLNGYFLSYLTQYGFNDFTNWNFWLGLVIFSLGFYVNQRSDSILISLRQSDTTEYKIPYGFLFNKISCPNHFGEILEWSGFALMAWNWPATTFLIWTLANLLPRSARHHRWYKEKFKNYPQDRKAVFPFLF